MSEMDYSKIRKPREPWYVDFICLETEKKDYPLHKWYAEQLAQKKKKQFRCPECGVRHNNIDDYMHHTLSKHNAYPCPICNGLCRQVMKNARSFVCSKCNTVFRKRSSIGNQRLTIAERSKETLGSSKRHTRYNKKDIPRPPKFDDSTLKSIEESMRQNEPNKNRFYTQLALASLAASGQSDDE